MFVCCLELFRAVQRSAVFDRDMTFRKKSHLLIPFHLLSSYSYPPIYGFAKNY